MVAPAPNLTRLTGTVLARRPHATLPDWDAVTLAVDASEGVDGKRDLVGPRRRGAGGPEVVVAVRRELLGAAAPGWRLTCLVKLTPGGPMAQPHPPEGRFAVEPGDGPSAAGPVEPGERVEGPSAGGEAAARPTGEGPDAGRQPGEAG